MSFKKPFLERTLVLTLTLKEAAEALGHDDWAKTNDYLDGDSHDDVYHDGYTIFQASHFHCPVRFAFELFPREVANSFEDVERDAWANALGDARRKSLRDAFLKMRPQPTEYRSFDSEKRDVMVSCQSGVTEVVVDTPNDQVQVTIQNPDHFVNELMAVGGRFEISTPVDEAMPEADLKKFFTLLACDYFEINAISIPDGQLPSQFSPDTNKEDLISIIEEKCHELSLADVASAVITACEAEKFRTLEEAISAAKSLTGFTSNEIKDEVKKSAQERIDAMTERMKKYTA